MGFIAPAPNTRPGMNSVGSIAAANSLKTGWPSGPSRNRRSGMNSGTRRASARRKSTFMASHSGSGVHSGSLDSTSVAPSPPPSTVLISAAAAGAHRRLADHTEPHAGERAGWARRGGVARVARGQDGGARHGRERIARVVVPADGIMERVQHPGAIGQRTAEDPGAITVDVGAD